MFKGYGSEEFQESLFRMEEVLTHFKTSSTMKKKEKIRILKAMRGVLKCGYPYFGFCFCYSDVVPHDWESDNHQVYRHTKELLGELGLTKPKRNYSADYWYPKSEKGNATRIRKINEAIKRLSK